MPLCHVSIVSGDYTLTTPGSDFKDVHKFNGISVPSNGSSCLTCHTDLSAFLPLTATGSSYNTNHRYSATTLAAKMLPAGGCANCHVNAPGNNFNLLSGTPTYLGSSVCKDCHSAKYNNWTNTMHRVMLTPGTTAQEMVLPLPPATTWDKISYVIVTKPALTYIDENGYFLAANDEYNSTAQEFEDSSHAGGAYGTCGRCHTTGWDASSWNASLLNGKLPGINGTFAEPGIGCERCHKPAGNGHQVVVNYSAGLCQECHAKGTGSHATGWEKGAHAPPTAETPSGCTQCHSPFDKYKNNIITEDSATNVACGVCHNVHDMTDDQYATLYSPGGYNTATAANIKVAKLAFFNATASLEAGSAIFDKLSFPALLYPGTVSDRKDTSYGTAGISVPGTDVSTILCSKCHFRHGLGHIAAVNLSHGTYYYGKDAAAACIDCHMEKAGSTERIVMKKHDLNALGNNSCGKAAGCHTTSAQNLSGSTYSVIPVIREWKASAHNDLEVGVAKDGYNHFYGKFNATTGVASSRANSCNKCHSPFNWNPLTDYYSNGTENKVTVPLTPDNFKGITCDVCHNLHDMGDWLAKTKAAFGTAKSYGWYNRDALVAATNSTTGAVTRYKANYTMMESTTELCGNCHSNIRIGNEGPGWTSATAVNPISPHGFPAKDIFVGSWKQTGSLKFECISCHMYMQTTDESGAILNDSQKIKGHSFKVNEAGLQNTSACSGCHAIGTTVGTIPDVIEDIQAATHTKWNSTNATVMAALAQVKAFTGEKNLSRAKIAQAYWNLRLVSSDESWGVRNPVKVNNLLNESITLANDSITALGVITKPVLTTIMVSPSTATLSIEDNKNFIATALDQNGDPMEGINVAWTSSDMSVGTVSPENAMTGADGKVTTTFTAIAAGTTMVNATNGSVIRSAEVVVNQEIEEINVI